MFFTTHSLHYPYFDDRTVKILEDGRVYICLDGDGRSGPALLWSREEWDRLVALVDRRFKEADSAK